MVSAPASPVSRDRLERFRGLRARLDPSGDPADAVEQFYVRAARSVSSRIAAELALSPASSHLLIGGVGSGKTTELLATQRELSQIGDVHAMYIDVSKKHDIAKISIGAVVADVGFALATLLAEEDSTIAISAANAESTVNGYLREERGVGSSLASFMRAEDVVRLVLEPLRDCLEILQRRKTHLVVLLDGLDRITELEDFERLVIYDVKALTSVGVGVVLVGPLRGLYGVERTVVQHFDSFHYQPWIDVMQSSQGAEFLVSVLQRRVPNVFDPAGIDRLVRASGGVLRDLLALAQAALVEAYMDGADLADIRAVDHAINAFGRKHMQGLRSSEIEVLQRVRTRGVFVHTSEDDLALLMTRRVLEYRAEGEPRYAVHPTIEGLLQQLGEK